MGQKFYYPQDGEPPVVHFDITGKSPSPQEVAGLTSVPIEKKSVSGEEIKEALTWFAFGCGAGVALWFFGRWVIGGFRGPGVLFFGYGAAYLAAPIFVLFGIVSLFKLIRSAQKTKPEDALRWVYEVSFLGEDAGGKDARFGKPEYSLATLARIVPDARGFDKEAARRYLEGFRDTLTRGMEITTAKARQDPPGNWRQSSPQKQMTITGTRELFPGVTEVSATISYKDILSRSDDKNNTINLIAAILELHVTNVMIRSGKYWYPYDIFPAVTCRQELPELPPAEEKAAAPVAAQACG